MKDEEFWINFTSLLPSGFDTDFDKNECTIKSGDKEVTVIRNENNFTINGKTLHFEDSDFEIINTLLVPYILQEFDGQVRL